jgi:hypothetical protein
MELEDERNVLQKEEIDDDKSSMKEEEYKQAILDLGWLYFKTICSPRPPKEARIADDEGFQGVDVVDNDKTEDDVPAVDLKARRTVFLQREKNDHDKSSMRVAYPSEAHSVEGDGLQGADYVDFKKVLEGALVMELEDERNVLQKEEIDDDKSSMKEEEYKQAILDLGWLYFKTICSPGARDPTAAGGRKAEDAPVVDFEDGREALQKEGNDDDKSSMNEEEVKQTIMDLHGQIRERDATIEELRNELHLKALNYRPNLQRDHVEPVLRFAWKFFLLMQASSKSLEKKKGKKAEPLVIGSNDFVADHLARHKFLDDTIPKRVEAMQNQYKSQQNTIRSQFARLKGVSDSFMSSRADLHKLRPAGDGGSHPPRLTGDGSHPQEMVSLMYMWVCLAVYKTLKEFCLSHIRLYFYFPVSPGTNGPKSPRW